MLKRVLVAAAALMVSVSLRVSAAPLGLGDAAPKIEVKEFVKGEPVKEFKKGQIYVVEFWATWCGPCRVSIPHLTALAKKHKDITFIGVSAFEQDASLVKPFVAKMGDKMDYHVAMDDVPAGGPGQSGKMAQNWMEAAKQNGIPTAFVIDKDTKIVWIGHPMEMEKPLDLIEAGQVGPESGASRAGQETCRAAENAGTECKVQAGGQRHRQATRGAGRRHPE